MRYPSLDSYDLTNVRSDEAAGWPDEQRDAWDEIHDADDYADAETLTR